MYYIIYNSYLLFNVLIASLYISVKISFSMKSIFALIFYTLLPKHMKFSSSLMLLLFPPF